jgi:glc operon protein GlcG
MYSRVLTTVMLSAALLAASNSHAQQAPQPNPLDAVPEQMPFDIPYGPPISVDEANAAIRAAEAEAKKNIAVVDSGGSLVAFERMDGAQLASIAISEHKARVAVMYRRDSKVFETSVQSGLTYQLTLDGMIASRGGIPLVVGGKLVGAIGCSGGTGSQDEVIAKAGAVVINR